MRPAKIHGFIGTLSGFLGTLSDFFLRMGALPGPKCPNKGAYKDKVPINVQKYIYVCVSLWMCVFICVYLCVYLFVCVCVSVYLSVCVCECVCV